MKTDTTRIKTTYFDGLFFAVAKQNKQENYSLSPTEFNIMLKLISYSSNQKNITWTSEQISKHLTISPNTVNKNISTLRSKGYINTSTFNVALTIKKRTIFINWEKLIEVDSLYQEYLKETYPDDIKEETKTNQEEPIQDEVIPEPINKTRDELDTENNDTQEKNEQEQHKQEEEFDDVPFKNIKEIISDDWVCNMNNPLLKEDEEEVINTVAYGYGLRLNDLDTQLKNYNEYSIEDEIYDTFNKNFDKYNSYRKENKLNLDITIKAILTNNNYKELINIINDFTYIKDGQKYRYNFLKSNQDELITT